MKTTLSEILEHTTKDRTPYTYVIKWSSHNVSYYGVRYRKNCHPKDLWKTYFTSSPLVRNFRYEFGEPDIIQIRKVFNCVEKARNWESRVLHRLNAVNSKKWLNKNYGSEKFDTTGHFAGKTKDGKVVWVNKNDENVLNGEIKGIQFGTVTVKDINGIKIQVSKKDPKYISGELVSIIKGTSCAYKKDTMEYVGRLSKYDPKWVSEDLVTDSYFKNKIPTTMGMVSKEDPRWLSGELKHIHTGWVTARDSKTGELIKGKVSIEDPRWLSGEIVGHTKGYVTCKCAKTGKSVGNISKNDPRLLSGDFIPATKGTTVAKDSKTGQCLGRVPISDPRWKTGEIVGIKAKLKML